MKQSQFTSHDGNKVALYVWDDVQSPKAVVKIAHGMAEHSARYDHFAQYLNSKGFIVVMNDHRGHGLSTEMDSLGYAEGDMWTNNVNDQIALIDYCADTYKLPVIMMGHSYGSFITQAVMEECPPNVSGYILCGSNYMKDISFDLCKIIARSMCRNKGGRHPAKLLVDLSFKMYEKKFPGKSAWLNRDADEVKKYNDDPMCGFVCSANFYRTFMEGISHLYKKSKYALIENKPLLIIAGSQDPVSNYSKGIKKLEKFYLKKVGLTDVTTHLYDGARHEILNEPLCKQQVYDDVVTWIEGALK